MTEEKRSCLLSDNVVPSHYRLTLKPDLATFTFEGKVFIHVNIKEPALTITLHAVDLDILAADVLVRYGSKETYSPQDVQFDVEEDTATFVFAEALPSGDAFLEIFYSGTINDKMCGFYRSAYTDANGETKYLAVTQFEATDARRALPCWDEPAVKATFNVSIVAPPKMIALSNMPDFYNGQNDERPRVIDFHQTPIMSTYLLAFIVGDLEFIEGHTKRGTQVRVYTVPGKKEHGRFALDVAIRGLEFFEKYFGIKYPLPKLDQVACPDFAAGAMENWGLITYRENAVLLDPINSSTAGKQRVAGVILHEEAHQWFGNLVTMQWWTELWLNEGFASFMGALATDALFPEWDIWTQFVGDDLAQALSLDGLRSTHPIEVEVEHPRDIRQIFDAISYSKGASVIRMIRAMIGDSAFREGIQIYLDRFAYSNATTEDLACAWEEASKKPVREIMKSWTKQPGYPLITVQGDGTDISLTQERFLAGGEELTTEEKAQQWFIELDSARRDTYQKDPTSFNKGRYMPVRMNYAPDVVRQLATDVVLGKLPTADRYGLLSDTLALARAGKQSTKTLIELLPNYSSETDYTVWGVVLGALGALDLLTEGQPVEADLARYARNLLTPIASKLGWQQKADESHTTQLLRGVILAALGGYKDDDVCSASMWRFLEWDNGKSPLEPNLRSAVYGICATYGKQEIFETLKRHYESETLQEERMRLLYAMGKLRDKTVLAIVLDYAFNSGKVRAGDFFYVLSSMGNHLSGREVAWFFLESHWKQIVEKYTGGGLMMLTRVISSICDNFTTEVDAQNIEQFFIKNPAPSAKRVIAEALERIRIRARWYERDAEVIAEALKQ